MLDVCLLGTGGMMPLPRRYLTSFLARYNGSSLMIDCGEGTQVAVKSKGWRFKPVSYTHLYFLYVDGDVHRECIRGIDGLYREKQKKTCVTKFSGKCYRRK